MGQQAAPGLIVQSLWCNICYNNVNFTVLTHYSSRK